jgi:transposase
MAAALLPDPLWDLVEPFLPAPPNRPKRGRPRVSDRACLTGILFVLRSGIPWQMLPQELVCGSGMTCWRRVRDWQQAGVWDLIHFALLDWLARSDQIDCVLGDRGYDAAVIRRSLQVRHIVPLLAMRRTAHGSGLGRGRWVVERAFLG